MPNYADYAPYRPALTAENQELIDHYSQGGIQEDGTTDADGIYRDGDFLFSPKGERQPIGPVTAQMQIALETAEDQLGAMGDYPEDLDDTKGFENVDPHGNYCRHDLSFAQRMAYIQQAAAVSSPEVQAAIAKANTALHAGHSASTAGNLYSQFKTQCEDHRLFTRAAKLCHSETGHDLLMEKATQREGGAIAAMDETLKGLEYAVGLRNDAPTLTQSKYMEDCFDMSPEEVEQLHQSTASKVPHATPATVPFSNFDNTLTHKYLAHPANWGKTPADAPADYRNQGVAEKDVQAYTATAVKGVMSALYTATESRHPGSKNPGGINRGKLITVDGKPLSQVMKERYLAEAQVMDYENWYKRNLETMSTEIVSAALLAGKRVEAFVTDAKGAISDQPYTIVKTGYEPPPLKPVTMNAFQSFMAKHGFYKEKVAQKEEYDRIMAGRAQLKSGNVIDQNEEVHKRLKENFVAGYASRCSQAGEDIPLTHEASLGRIGITSLCSGYMLAMGYSVDDVLDPNKLLEEKKKVGELYTDLSQAIRANTPREKEKEETKEAYDAYLADFNADTPANEMRKRAGLAARQQMGEMMYMGHRAHVDAFNKRVEGRDLADLANQADFPTLEFLGKSAFDIGQEKRNYLAEYQAAAINDFHRNPDMQAKLASDPAFQGYVPGAPLTPQQEQACAEYTHTESNNIAVITDFNMRAHQVASGKLGTANPLRDAADCITAQTISNQLRELQRKHPDVPASNLLLFSDAAGIQPTVCDALAPLSKASPQEKTTIYNDLHNGTMQNFFRDLTASGPVNATTREKCAEMVNKYIQDRLPETHQRVQQAQKKAQQQPRR